MYLGIDCGTQGTKVVLFDPEQGAIVARGHARHALMSDSTGRREQKAEWWITALREALAQMFGGSRYSPRDVVAMGVSGQQHGLVMLDERGQVLRDVKLWNDTTTTAANESLHEAAGGSDGVWNMIHTTLPVGFTASKIAWMRAHEPDVFARTRHVLLPHDYLNFWLTGDCVTDAGEASGTGYFDVAAREWSRPMVDLLDPSGGLERALPRVMAPLAPIGTVRAAVAEELGFAPGTLVACGSGDNVMGAVGTGSVVDGRVTLGLGTSGVINLCAERYSFDVDRSVQVFCGLEKGWLPTVATMNATSSTSLMQGLFQADLDEVERLMASAAPGAEGVRVFPFFSGERIPALPRARAAIRGLSHDNFTHANLMRATAESVAFGLHWGMNRLARTFGRPQQFALTGGGANSAAWRQILADVMNTEVVRVKVDEGGAFAAALLSLAVAQNHRGTPTTLHEVCDRFVALDYALSAQPRPAVVEQYQGLFARYSAAISEENFDA